MEKARKAKPRPLYGFDGKIGLWEIGDEVAAKRVSKFYDKGDLHIVNVTIVTDKFIEMCINNVISSILEKVTWDFKIVRV